MLVVFDGQGHPRADTAPHHVRFKRERPVPRVSRCPCGRRPNQDRRWSPRMRSAGQARRRAPRRWSGPPPARTSAVDAPWAAAPDTRGDVATVVGVATAAAAAVPATRGDVATVVRVATAAAAAVPAAIFTGTAPPAAQPLEQVGKTTSPFPRFGSTLIRLAKWIPRRPTGGLRSSSLEPCETVSFYIGWNEEQKN